MKYFHPLNFGLVDDKSLLVGPVNFNGLIIIRIISQNFSDTWVWVSYCRGLVASTITPPPPFGVGTDWVYSYSQEKIID